MGNRMSHKVPFDVRIGRKLNALSGKIILLWSWPVIYGILATFGVKIYGLEWLPWVSRLGEGYFVYGFYPFLVATVTFILTCPSLIYIPNSEAR